MMNKLIFAHKQVLKPYVESLISSSTDASSEQIQQLQTAIAQCNEKRETLIRLMAQGIIDRILFTKEVNALSAKSNRYRRELEKLNSTLTDDSEKLSEAKALLQFASKSTMLDAFDENLFQRFVDHIVIVKRNEVCFTLKCGLDLTERIG